MIDIMKEEEEEAAVAVAQQAPSPSPVKKTTIAFRIKKAKMGDKIILIIPKNYREDVSNMQDPLEVFIREGGA